MTALVDRRVFLASFLAAFRVLAGAGPARAAQPSKAFRALERAGILQLLPEESARTLGHEYLRSLSARPTATKEGLERLVEVAARWQPPGGPHAVEEMRGAVAAAVRRDFMESRTVRVRNWILSETEAEICALVAGRQALL